MRPVTQKELEVELLPEPGHHGGTRLASERLGVPPDDLKEVTGDREGVLVSLLRLLPTGTESGESDRRLTAGWISTESQILSLQPWLICILSKFYIGDE